MATFEICYGSGLFENLPNRLTTDILNLMTVGIALQYSSLCNYYINTSFFFESLLAENFLSVQFHT